MLSNGKLRQGSMSDKRAALNAIFDKLAKLIPLLASDKLGEVFNTAQVIAHLLGSVKLDFHDSFVSGEEAPVAALLRSLADKDQDALFRLGLTRASLFHSHRTQRPDARTTGGDLRSRQMRGLQKREKMRV